MPWVQLYPHIEYIIEIKFHPITCSAKHNWHAYSFHCSTPPTPPPINKHSGPKDTIYVNHSGASIKQQVSSWTPWLDGGSSGFPDIMTCPGGNWGLLLLSERGDNSLQFFWQLSSLVQDGNRFPLFKYQTHTAQNENVKIPCWKGWRRASGVQWSLHCVPRPTCTPKME